MSFWALAALMMLAAVLCVVVPLIRSSDRARGRMAPDVTIRELYRERLQELDRESAEGRLGAAARAELVRELDATLLAEYRGDDVAEPAPARRAPLLALVFVVVVPAAALFVYLYVGDPTAERALGAEALLGLDPQTDGASIADWRDRLVDRVRARPDDAHSWYLIGHAGLQLGEFQRAAEAFSVVHALRGPDPNVDIYWLQARYLAARGTMDSSSRQIADRLLEGNSNHPLVLELMAVDAYRSGDPGHAVALLNRALSGNLNPDRRESLAASLRQARERLGDLQPSIDVAVSAEGEAPVHATLFVIARPVGGGMPYAVVRRTAAFLPGSVRLDDAVSMDPARSLSSASSVEVVVRLSRSGRPTPAPGDWEWRSLPIDVQTLEGPLQLQARLRPLAPVDG